MGAKRPESPVKYNYIRVFKEKLNKLRFFYVSLNGLGLNNELSLGKSTFQILSKLRISSRQCFPELSSIFSLCS